MTVRTRDKYPTVKALPATLTAVAHPCDEASLSGAIDAAKMNIIVPILVGPRHKILTAAKAANLSADVLDSRNRCNSSCTGRPVTRHEGARCTSDLIGDLHCYSHDDPDTGSDDKMVGEQAKTFG